MIINNSIQFADLATKLQLKNTDIFMNYFQGYSKICNCKPTLKNLYYAKMEKSYIQYVGSNLEHIKEKIESSDINDSILEFKNNDKIFCSILFHKKAL